MYRSGMAKLNLPVIDRLEATPELLRLLLDGLTEEDAQWKPAPDRYSIAEVLEHLSHLEGHGYRARVDAVLGENEPEVVPYDDKALQAAGAYSGGNAEDSFDHFEDQRLDLIECLREQEAGVEKRKGRHPEIGLFTLEEMLNAIAMHDLGHVRQITELVRARQIQPALGGFSQWYSTKA